MRTSRRRRAAGTFLVAAVTAVGILAAPGLGANLVKHRFRAPLQGGVNNAVLELNAYFKKGTPKTVTDFQWANLSCPTGGYIPFSGVQHWSAGVNAKGKFNVTHAVHNGGGAKVTITGKFAKKNGKEGLAGTFKLTNLSTCSSGTGKLAYNARQK